MNTLVTTEQAEVPVSVIPDKIAWQSLSPNTRTGVSARAPKIRRVAHGEAAI